MAEYHCVGPNKRYYRDHLHGLLGFAFGLTQLQKFHIRGELWGGQRRHSIHDAALSWVDKYKYELHPHCQWREGTVWSRTSSPSPVSFKTFVFVLSFPSCVRSRAAHPKLASCQQHHVRPPLPRKALPQPPQWQPLWQPAVHSAPHAALPRVRPRQVPTR